MITQNELKKNLSYDPLTGLFTWIKRRPKIKVGDIAGNVNKDDYVIICVNLKKYSAHRLAFLYMTGSIPKEQIDHINHNRSDNRWDNLRAVTHLENGKNRSKSERNTSGVTGVSWNKSRCRWVGQICVDGQRIGLGYHVKFSDAVDARKNAEVLYGFHENHGKDLV